MELELHVSDHAASMLAGLNLQRGRIQFCDCLIRQRQSPNQFYPAHRCVLAASSPVLASILSSNGTLVELQDPCLSDSVLAQLFDYIYTGTLPNIHSQHQYCSLITAAHYLQMDELQEALRAWQQTETNNGDDTKNTYTVNGTLQRKDSANLTSAKFPPLSPSMNVFRQPVESSLHRVSSLEKKDGHFSETVEMCYDGQTISVKTGSYTKDGEKSTRTCSMKDDTSPSSRDTGTSSDVNTICRISKTTANNHYKQVPQNLTEHISSTADTHGVPRVSKHGKNDLFHSMGIVKLHTWQRSKEDLFRTVKDERSDSLCGVAVQEEDNIAEMTQHLNSTLKAEAEDKQANAEVKKPQSPLPPLFSSPVSLCTSCNNTSPTQSTTSSCTTSLPPRFGAVPVICHSSRAALVQVTEASTRPPYHPVAQPSTCPHRAPVLQSTCIDNNNIVKGIVPQHTTCNGERNQDYRGNRDHFCKNYLEDKDSFGQCVLQDLCYKSNTDQSGMLRRDYNSSPTDHCIIQNDKQTSSALSHITWRTMGENCSQIVNSTKHVRDESLLQNNEGLQYGSGHPSPSHYPAKRQRLKYNECKAFSLETASRESIHSHVKSPVAPVTVQESYQGEEFNSEMMCLKNEVKEEHSYCVHGSKADLSQKDETIQSPTTQDSRLDNVRGSFCAFEQCTSSEDETMTTSETLEPHSSFSVPTESTMSYPVFDFVEQSYEGQLHYHCLSQDDTRISFGQSGYRQSDPDYPDHPDQSSDEKEASAYASPLRQHPTTMNEDVLLLNISTKPTELFLSYKEKSREGGKVGAFGKTDTFPAMIWNNHGDERDTTNNTDITTRAGFDSGGFVKDESKAWIQERSPEHRKQVLNVGTSQQRPGERSIHKAESWVLEEASKESGKQTDTMTCCTSASVPGSVQNTMSSTLSVYIAPTLSMTMPTNISTPEHHLFQCSLCDRCFSQRGSLNRHVRSHLGVRPFPCPQCPMTFSRQYRVTEHMRVHQRCAIANHFQKPSV